MPTAPAAVEEAATPQPSVDEALSIEDVARSLGIEHEEGNGKEDLSSDEKMEELRRLVLAAESEEQRSTDDRPGSKRPPRIYKTNNGFIIDLPESEEIREYCEFSLRHWRAWYKSFVDQTIEAVRLLVENVPGFSIMMVDLHIRIHHLEGSDLHISSPEALGKEVRNLLCPPDDPKIAKRILRVVQDHVSSLYRTGNDGKGVDITPMKVKGSLSQEIEFTNEHAMTILQWSIGTLISLPFIDAYCAQKNIKGGDPVMTVTMEVFCQVLKVFEDSKNSDILLKIYNLFEKKVNQSIYSDKNIWLKLRSSMADSPAHFTNTVFRRFVTTIIPKTQQGTNIVSFYYTFIKNQLYYHFKVKFYPRCRPIQNNVVNRDEVNAQERLEVEMICKDEGYNALVDANTRSVLSKMRQEMGVPEGQPSSLIDRNLFYLKEYGINSFQQSMVTKLFLPYFRKIDFIRVQTMERFNTMQVLLMLWLHHHEMPILRKCMGSQVEVRQGRERVLAKTKFKFNLIESQEWREMIRVYYAQSDQLIVNSDVVLGTIQTMQEAKFTTLPYPEFGEDGDKEILFSTEAVGQEILRFIKLSILPRQEG